MRGTGTKQDTTIAERSVLLDLTRLVRRAGQRQTGVDRVEYAYLQECINRFPESLFGLVRTGLGYLILDHTGCQAVLGKCQSENWGRIRGLAKFAYKLTPTQRSAQSFLPAIALQLGLSVAPDVTPDPIEAPHDLADVYDDEIETLVHDAYQKDYVMFGFGSYR
jgi:hypothetical protein